MPPKFSIALCAYNSINYIDACVDSLLKQTFTDFELIIVDDGSTDGTAEYIHRIQDSRVKPIILESNRGLIFARSMAFSLAAGDYIALMDADDIAHPNRLEEQFKILSSGKADICGTRYQTLDTASGRLRKRSAYQHNADIRALLGIYCPLCNPSVSFRRALLDQVAYRPEYRHAEDYAFWTELSALNHSFYIVPSCQLTYRIHTQQISRVMSGQAREAFVKAQGIYIKRLLDTDTVPQSMPWRQRRGSAMAFMRTLNQRLPGISMAANYEIYAEFQYRRNGLLTPLLRLERLLVALYWTTFGGWTCSGGSPQR